MRTALLVPLVALWIGWPAGVAAQTSEPTPAAASVPAEALAVDVRRRAVRPGEILAIDVRAPATATAVAATLGERTIPLWQRSPSAWRGLAGLDVEQPPGPLVLTVTASGPRSAALVRTVTLDVQPAAFAERHLRVAPRFVEPPEAERPRIDRERQRLQAIYQTASTDREPGAFVAPVPHRRSSPFGSRSVFNGVPRDRHAGLDFASPAGAVIRAPAPGRVMLVDALYYTGNTVVIDHGYGLVSVFAHLQRTTVEEGMTVSRGTRLGTVGATGRATGPHLHWSVRVGTTRVDPAAVLDVLAPASPAAQAAADKSIPAGARRPR
jgi:murein DD-endopeptidase MepM/ murein hydrolase activator NlpD